MRFTFQNFSLLVLIMVGACGSNDDPQTLSGYSQYAFLVVPDVTTYDFGTKQVGTSTDKAFIIENRGMVAATNILGHFAFSAYSFKGGTFPGSGGTCDTSIDPGELCLVVITFAPTFPGTFNEFLQLSYESGNGIRTTTSPIIKGKATP